MAKCRFWYKILHTSILYLPVFTTLRFSSPFRGLRYPTTTMSNERDTSQLDPPNFYTRVDLELDQEAQVYIDPVLQEFAENDPVFFGGWQTQLKLAKQFQNISNVIANG